MALIWWSGNMGWSAASSLILRGKWCRNWESGRARFESRYSRILAWIWPSDILTTLIILLYRQQRNFRDGKEGNRLSLQQRKYSKRVYV